MRLIIIFFFYSILNSCTISDSHNKQNHIKDRLNSKTSVISTIKTGISINY